MTFEPFTDGSPPPACPRAGDLLLLTIPSGVKPPVGWTLVGRPPWWKRILKRNRFQVCQKVCT